jgi:hypothetical protein
MEATSMKALAVFSTATLAVLLGISAPVYAQQDESHPQEEKRAQPDEKAAHDQDKQEDKRADKDKADKQDNKEKDKHEQEERSARQDEGQGQRREGREGGHIPDDRFRASFGREHTFHIGHPVIVEGTPRFQYGGYWFVIAQPWPVGWAYTDVVYVDFIDGGYYLLSPVHPGIQISINVIL